MNNNNKGPLPISSSATRYPLTAICEWSPVVVAEAIDPGECENAKDSNISAADVVVPPQNPDFINELQHDRLCTTIVSSLEDLDINEPVHRSSPLARVSNTNTSTQEDDMKLPVWKRKRYFVGVCLILVFFGVLITFVAFAAPSSKETDESNTVGGGNIRGTTMNSSDILQSSQVSSRRSGPVVEDRPETHSSDSSSESGTNTTTTKPDTPRDIEHDELDRYDADPSGLD